MAGNKGQGKGPKQDGEPEDVEAKALKVARFDAEQRFRKILERRNALNDEARQAREARDAINAERRRVYDEAQVALNQRNDVAAKIKEHKAKRAQFQDRARQLIALKNEKRKGSVGGAGQKLRTLEAEVKALEFKQQTVPMSGPKELELLDEIKVKMREMEELRKVKSAQDLIFGEVKDLDQAINDAFATADAEHAQVVELSKAWQELTDKLDPAFASLGHMKAEADKKHQDFLDLRKRADEEHAKAGALYGEVGQARDAESALWHERKQIVQDIKRQVRETFDNPAALDANADEAIKLLKEKGRISL